MNENIDEMIADMLAKKATVGLEPSEQKELNDLLAQFGGVEDNSFEIAAAAINLADIDANEPLPSELQARILKGADKYFSEAWPPVEMAESTEASGESEFQKIFTIDAPVRGSWNWLGWALAGVACIALALNVWFTRFQPTEVTRIDQPPATPEKLTPEQEFAQLSSRPGVTKANWAPGNVKEMTDVSGDVVWSDESQKGYLHLRGLPVNDVNKETYQLWIFDKTQDKKTPIDGGTFDVQKNGDVIIPIDAKLRALEPELFAITVEKPGGVVVSKREKIAALATVEPPARSST